MKISGEEFNLFYVLLCFCFFFSLHFSLGICSPNNEIIYWKSNFLVHEGEENFGLVHDKDTICSAFILNLSLQMLPLTHLSVFRPGQMMLLHSWRFSRYSAPTHWLVHGHMTSNNQTVSRQMPWAGNIAKTMTSDGKQFTVTREMLTAVAGISAHYSKFAIFFVLLYNKSLNDWSLGEQWILFPSNLNVSLDFVSGNIEIRGKQNSLFPSGPVIKCSIFNSDLHQICPYLP